MSRGPGNLQQIILDRVQASRGGVSLNRLLWDVAAERGGAAPSITDSFDSGFRRAVRRLAAGNHLRKEKRRLTGFDELIELYPHKSGDSAVRNLRLQLLPVARAYLAERHARKFSPADNERHLYRDLPDDARARAEASWLNLEPALYAALADASASAREAVFDLLVRGQQLFRRRPVRHRVAFIALLGQAIAVAADRLPAAAIAELQAIAAAFPARILARLKLKSDLYEIAQLGRDRSQHVKDDFIDYAMRAAPAVMRSLPGFKAAWSERVGKLRMPHKDQHSPLIHKLLQRDAMAPFEFLSIGRDGDEPATRQASAAERNRSADSAGRPGEVLAL